MTQVTRAQKVRLGIFLATGLTVLVGGMVVLAGMKLGEKRDRYVVRWSDANVSLSGLDIGSPVKYSGIRVGRVESVRIDPKDVGVIVVEITLDHNTPVAEDSKANLGSTGITGLKYIELTRGSAAARVRKPGEQIPPGTSAFDALTNQAGEIANKVQVVLDRVADLTNAEMKDRIARILDRSEKLITSVDNVVNDNREALKKLAEKLSGAADQVEVLSRNLAGTAERANKLLDEATALVKNARGVPERVNALLDTGTKVLGPEGLGRTIGTVNTLLAQSRHDLLEAIDYLRDTAENASALAEKLREDPTLLLRREDSE